jgi:glycerophosphoryl diester phosphodiesterase
MSSPPRHAFLDHDGPIPFAHRGGASDWPENTMPAFEGAVRLGFRYIETDVQVTSDGVLLAFHDDDLGRVTDRSGRIHQLPWSEVRKARVDGREPIPLLEELFSTWPEVRVNIDAKRNETVEPLVVALRRAGALDRVCVGSFSGRRVARLRRLLGPGLCTSMSPFEAVRWRLGSLVPMGAALARVPAACIQVPVRQGPLAVVDHRSVGLAHELGLPVHVWTIDDPVEMDRLLDLGVDGIMTDRPAVLKDVMIRRGLWRE